MTIGLVEKSVMPKGLLCKPQKFVSKDVLHPPGEHGAVHLHQVSVELDQGHPRGWKSHSYRALGGENIVLGCDTQQ